MKAGSATRRWPSPRSWLTETDDFGRSTSGIDCLGRRGGAKARVALVRAEHRIAGGVNARARRACAALEAEVGEDEARATVVGYLEALGGAEPDRGWSILSERMRDGFMEEIYLRWASTAVGPPPITGH